SRRDTGVPRSAAGPRNRGPGRRDAEPVRAVTGQGEQVGPQTDVRERRAAGQLNRDAVLEPPGEGGLYRLRGTGQAVYTEDGLDVALGVDVFAEERQHRRVRAVQVLERALGQGSEPFADLDHPTGPLQQRVRLVDLAFHVDRLVAVHPARVGRQIEPV